uniref:Uncharacterized protein n=1 Tax=Moniliophthora roreri TaxID=221103 RepID=A0A0W0FG16_MONRR
MAGVSAAHRMGNIGRPFGFSDKQTDRLYDHGQFKILPSPISFALSTHYSLTLVNQRRAKNLPDMKPGQHGGRGSRSLRNEAMSTSAPAFSGFIILD